MYKKPLVASFVHSLIVVAYVTGIATLMFNAEKLFGNMNSVLGPITILLLFCVSAAVVGLLVFGRPAYLFLNGMKREGVSFLFYTIGYLAVEVLFLLAILLILNNA